MPPATWTTRMLTKSQIAWEIAKKYGMPFLLLGIAVYHLQSQVNKLDARTVDCQREQLQLLQSVVKENTAVMQRLLDKIQDAEQ